MPNKVVNITSLYNRIPLSTSAIAKTDVTPNSVYDASIQQNVAVTADGIIQQLKSDALVARLETNDMAPFDFNLYFPSGEKGVTSTDFIGFYGTHKKVWDALKGGRLHFDDAHAGLDLLEYFWKQWPDEMAQIPSIAYKAKVIGW